MGFASWPSGLPPYTAYTYVTDRVTPVNHQSIMNGLARDIAALQHNINTTNLFASGYAHPTTSGFFKNISTDYLYALNFYTKKVFFYEMIDPNIGSLEFRGTTLNFIDTALQNNNLKISEYVSGNYNFLLNNTGFRYSPSSISGSLYSYNLVSGGAYSFVQGILGSLDAGTNVIVVDNDHKVIIENLGAFAPSGLMNESVISWHPSAGHNHKTNKIIAGVITASDVLFLDDLAIDSKDGSIDIVSGVLDADTYHLETYYDNITFYELDFTGSGVYTCDYPTGTSGFVRELDIGTGPMISFEGYVYATSKVTPTGFLNNSAAYVYKSKDLYTWEGAIVSGNLFPNASGIATVDDFAVNQYDSDSRVLNILWNMKTTDGNHSAVIPWAQNPGGNVILGFRTGLGGYTNVLQYQASAYADGSSRYSLGLSVVDENLMVYGYEYPHVALSGIPKWDKHCLYWNNSNQSMETGRSDQDVSYAGCVYNYSTPFIQNVNVPNYYYFLDGSIGTREPYFTEDINDTVFKNLPLPNLEFSGYFGAFYGNGFSEITAILPTDGSYHNGQRGYFTHTTSKVGATFSGGTHPDILMNYANSPVLVFGNSTVCIDATGIVNSGNIFGGCVPIVIDVDKRLFSDLFYKDVYLNSTNAHFGVNYLHGARSLLDDNLLFRLPSYHYYSYNFTYSSLINSNLWGGSLTNIGRMWTDYTWPSGLRTEYINICPWIPGYMVSPFGGNEEIYFQHLGEPNLSKISYVLCTSNVSGILYPYDAYVEHRNYPTFYDRPVKNGFWKEKTFDWYYNPGDSASGSYKYNGSGMWVDNELGGFIFLSTDGDPFSADYTNTGDKIIIDGTQYNIDEYNYSYPGYLVTDSHGTKDIHYAWESVKTWTDVNNDFPNPPSGKLPQTYYYMKPRKPIQHNGVVYCILEDNSGYVYLGPNGSEYIDNGVIYSDLIKYGNTIYGIGTIATLNQNEKYDYRLVLSVIRRNTSVETSLSSTVYGSRLTNKFVVHRGLLFIGIGKGRFLVKKPAHTDLCITTNL